VSYSDSRRTTLAHGFFIVTTISTSSPGWHWSLQKILKAYGKGLTVPLYRPGSKSYVKPITACRPKIKNCTLGMPNQAVDRLVAGLVIFIIRRLGRNIAIYHVAHVDSSARAQHPLIAFIYFRGWRKQSPGHRPDPIGPRLGQAELGAKNAWDN
jgi:hypothetical protein